MKFFTLSLIFSIINLSHLTAQSISVVGTVLNDQTQAPLSNVNVIFNNSGTSTNLNGKFEFVADYGDSVSFAHIGYKPIKMQIKANMLILMQPTSLIGNSIDVSAYRAISGLTPVSFSSLTAEEIKLKYTVQDIPMVLSTEPGVWAYSESGNGTGYSYASIRGFDQSRIAVLFDGVPMNDNESHQVYWVDHGDLLADTKDIQIQRGIGTSLYGSSSFGGSINVRTQISSNSREINFSHGLGNWNTKKYRFKYLSGKDFGEKTSLVLRMSTIDSDGYRKEHGSSQRGLFFGLEHQGKMIKNQFRAIIGYENTKLTWDGIAKADIDDLEKRRAGNKAYTDDFLQQIYSLNSTAKLNKNLSFRNVSYLVIGKGYYEVFKLDQDYYSYNLDFNDAYDDQAELSMKTDLLRRKWIDNHYYGIVPMLTYNNNDVRFDLGGEFRIYSGDHYGEVTQFSNPQLNAQYSNNWYRYYQYLGKKNIFTGFARILWSPVNQPFAVSIDIQNQNIHWDLNQEIIGHAAGHNLSADWNFLNPRVGILWDLGDSLSWFVNIGKAQKEPADNQIITADDMFSKPVMAANEVISDLELGMNFSFSNGYAKINGYRILFLNEQLKNINLDQEGEYSYYSADSTTHSGFEYESYFQMNTKTAIAINGAMQMNVFNNGKSLPNSPSTLFNLSVNYDFNERIFLFAHLKRIGGMYIDNINSEDGYINGYGIIDLGAHYSWKSLKISLQINNALNKLYSTYGYGYDYEGYNAFYWPGATRNMFINISYSL